MEVLQIDAKNWKIWHNWHISWSIILQFEFILIVQKRFKTYRIFPIFVSKLVEYLFIRYREGKAYRWWILAKETMKNMKPNCRNTSSKKCIFKVSKFVSVLTRLHKKRVWEEIKLRRFHLMDETNHCEKSITGEYRMDILLGKVETFLTPTNGEIPFISALVDSTYVFEFTAEDIKTLPKNSQILTCRLLRMTWDCVIWVNNGWHLWTIILRWDVFGWQAT